MSRAAVIFIGGVLLMAALVLVAAHNGNQAIITPADADVYPLVGLEFDLDGVRVQVENRSIEGLFLDTYTFPPADSAAIRPLATFGLRQLHLEIQEAAHAYNLRPVDLPATTLHRPIRTERDPL